MNDRLNLPPAFRHVRLVLAREKGHPAGDLQMGYDFLIPLTDEGRIDAVVWKRHQSACRVRRFRDDEQDRIGRLRRKPGGQWYVDFVAGERDDEMGFRFGEERFVTGEYVSIGRKHAMHTYQIARVEKP
ncbi:MAG: hypothetical protein KF914_15035 [Rhizobiaceae bacterium]|nr:hypothetical protein [Rhizobiaceae bacterium]